MCWLKGGAASRPRSDACCVSGDARPGGDAAARAAAARTAELEAQRDLYRGERISSAEKVNVAGARVGVDGARVEERQGRRFPIRQDFRGRLRRRTFRF